MGIRDLAFPMSSIFGDELQAQKCSGFLGLGVCIVSVTIGLFGHYHDMGMSTFLGFLGRGLGLEERGLLRHHGLSTRPNYQGVYHLEFRSAVGF